jgi:hypothetical protein
MVRATITVTGLEEWIGKLTRLAAEPSDVFEERWTDATKYMFDRSQSHVRVITGQLKSSGWWAVETDPTSVEATVAYDAPYAFYEHARGGDHAFLQLAYLDAEDRFEEALADGWEELWQ